MKIELNEEEIRALCDVLDGTLDPMGGEACDFLDNLYAKLTYNAAHYAPN